MTLLDVLAPEKLVGVVRLACVKDTILASPTGSSSFHGRRLGCNAGF